MRKRMVLTGTAIAILTGTLAWAAPGDRPAAAAAAPRPAVTVQRLLGERLDLALKLARLLQARDVVPEGPTVYGTQTIVDEPDPTSSHRSGPQPDHWPVVQPRNSDSASPGTASAAQALQ